MGTAAERGDAFTVANTACAYSEALKVLNQWKTEQSFSDPDSPRPLNHDKNLLRCQSIDW